MQRQRHPPATGERSVEDVGAENPRSASPIRRARRVVVGYAATIALAVAAGVYGGRQAYGPAHVPAQGLELLGTVFFVGGVAMLGSGLWRRLRGGGETGGDARAGDASRGQLAGAAGLVAFGATILLRGVVG